MVAISGSANGLRPLGAAARRAGVTPRQLQYYLMVGVVEASARSIGGRRFFDRSAIRRIRLVHLVNRMGYPLREVREIFMDPRGPNSSRRLRPARPR